MYDQCLICYAGEQHMFHLECAETVPVTHSEVTHRSSQTDSSRGIQRPIQPGLGMSLLLPAIFIISVPVVKI